MYICICMCGPTKLLSPFAEWMPSGKIAVRIEAQEKKLPTNRTLLALTQLSFFMFSLNLLLVCEILLFRHPFGKWVGWMHSNFPMIFLI